jgi:hypothetical protein
MLFGLTTAIFVFPSSFVKSAVFEVSSMFLTGISTYNKRNKNKGMILIQLKFFSNAIQFEEENMS